MYQGRPISPQSLAEAVQNGAAMGAGVGGGIAPQPGLPQPQSPLAIGEAESATPTFVQGEGDPTDPLALAQAMMAGAQGAPGEAKPTLGSGGGYDALGQLAQAAQQAHQKANGSLYNDSGALNHSRAMGDAWAPEVKRY